ncbi:hypothetical protein D3C73_1370750 [compost metagenome]
MGEPGGFGDERSQQPKIAVEVQRPPALRQNQRDVDDPAVQGHGGPSRVPDRRAQTCRLKACHRSFRARKAAVPEAQRHAACMAPYVQRGRHEPCADIPAQRLLISERKQHVPTLHMFK